MIVLSVRANTRFRKEQKLPMQWMISRSQPLSSTVIRSAPRVIALGFVPFLGITVLSLFAIGATTLTPRPGQEGMLLPSLIFIGSIQIGRASCRERVCQRVDRGGRRIIKNKTKTEIVNLSR